MEESDIQMKLQEQYTVLQGSSAKGCQIFNINSFSMKKRSSCQIVHMFERLTSTGTKMVHTVGPHCNKSLQRNYRNTAIRFLNKAKSKTK